MIHVILNSGSGASSKPETAERVVELFQTAGRPIHLHQPTSSQGVAIAVQKALGEQPEAVVAGGGDGTVNAVATALVGGSTPLGVLPLGTWNHFAKDVQIPLDLPAAVQTVACGQVRRVDVGRINDRIFLNNASIGVYPNIVEARDRLRQQGYRKWMAFAVATLEVLRREDEVSVRLEVDGRQMISRTSFVFIGNNEYLVEGIRLGARTRLDGGRLHACLAPPGRTRDLPRLLGHALLGRARQGHALESLSAVDIVVETFQARQIKVACDGELLVLTTPLHFRSWPGALYVLAPAA